MNIRILHGRYQAADGLVLDVNGQVDTIDLVVSEERIQGLLKDFPDQFEEIKDEKAYLKSKQVVADAAVEVPAEESQAAKSPFDSDPMTTRDSFQNVEGSDTKARGKKGK